MPSGLGTEIALLVLTAPALFAWSRAILSRSPADAAQRRFWTVLFVVNLVVVLLATYRVVEAVGLS